MKEKTPLGFLLVLSVLALGALAIYNAFNPRMSIRDVRNAREATDSSNNVKAQTLVDLLPLAPRVESEVWLNSPKLNWDDLRGKVVLVEFWTFG